MSQRSHVSSRDPYAVIDVDAEEDAWQIAADHADRRHSTPPIAPQVVADSNRTRHSVASGIPIAAAAAISPRPLQVPTLPNGEVITAKNTLQSFDSVPGQIPYSPAVIQRSASSSEGKRSKSSSSSTNPASSVVPSATAVAVAVDHSPDNAIVYAELAPALVPAPELVPPRNVAAADAGNNNHAVPTAPWYKSKYTVVVLLAVVALLLAVVLGVYIGSTVGGNDTPTVPVTTGGAPPSPTLPTSPAPTNNPLVTGSPFMLPTSAKISTQNPTTRPTLPETAEPTPSPATVRTQVLTDYINNITLSGQTISADGTSAESQALAWMIASDTTLNTSALAMVSREEGTLADTPIGFLMRQRYALLTMWFQQDVTVWARTDNWLIDPDECQWYGIFCETVTEKGGSRRAVTQILLSGTRSYVGAIPADIGLLSYLQHIEIRDTYDEDSLVSHVQGTLPESLGLLTRLTHFDVYNNRFTGSLPESIGMWKELTYFEVGSNALTGTLPSTIGMWNQLTNFDAFRNKFTGSFPTGIENWTGMAHFHVDNAKLTGTLPDGIGRWTALTVFTVAVNNLNGTIPASIGNWSLIEMAYFDNNTFVGTLTESICLHINRSAGDELSVDCDVSCTCCTGCSGN